MSDLTLLGDATADTMAALVFELASQLHEERVRRLALEQVLEDGGFDLGAVEALADDDAFREQSRSAADLSIRRLLRLLEGDGPPEAPLRGETPAGP